MNAENSYPTTVNVNGTVYNIDAETAAALQTGIVPADLRKQIQMEQGAEFFSDFRRQCKLIRDATDQIENGELPASLLDLIQSREVPAAILYMLTKHKLIDKAEKLYKHKLITLEVLNTVRREYLTPEILPALKQAFLLDTAIYLFHHREISKETLDGFRNGSIDPRYFLVIVSHYYKLGNLRKQEQNHNLYELPDERGILYHYENLPDPKQQPERIASVSYVCSCLYEAMTWLAEEDYYLIRCIFFEDISLRQLARDWDVSEGTIRYKKKKALRRLRVLLEGVFEITREDIFEPDRM